MSIDVHGWVEVKVDGIWTGMIQIDSTIYHYSDIFNLLFIGQDAIAGNRGTPDDHSHLMINEGWGASWIAWGELERIDWSQHKDHFIFIEDWRYLFDMMGLYSQVPVVTDVRLIVSFF